MGVVQKEDSAVGAGAAGNGTASVTRLDDIRRLAIFAGVTQAKFAVWNKVGALGVDQATVDSSKLEAKRGNFLNNKILQHFSSHLRRNVLSSRDLVTVVPFLDGVLSGAGRCEGGWKSGQRVSFCEVDAS